MMERTDAARLAQWRDDAWKDLQGRVTAMEKWQSAHEAICAMRWKVLQRIAVIGFVWLTVLIVGSKAPFAEALLKLLP